VLSDRFCGEVWLRGKPWSIEEERELRELINKGVSVDEIAQIMCKTRLSIRGKMNNLGLTVVVAAARQHRVATTTTTSTAQVVNDAPIVDPAPASYQGNIDLFAAQLERDKPLPSVKDKLRVLDAALVALERPGLSIAETTRLNKIILGVKVYQQLFADFVKYQTLESEVLELRRQLAAEKDKK
jgi:hypothetical protein